MDNDKDIYRSQGTYAPIFALSSGYQIFMCHKILKSFVYLIGFLLLAPVIKAQTEEPLTCFNAQEILFPLENNDFSTSQIMLNKQKVNALYYLYNDKYSFWYKFIAQKDIKIEFSVSASNANDRYRAVAFKYGNADFCDRLINDNMQPMRLNRIPIFNADGSVLYKNSIEAAAGDTFYISVLSLNREDCGHFLYMEAEGQTLSVSAIHKPCYDFIYLEAPDFSAAKKIGYDVQIDLYLDKEAAAMPDDPLKADTGFTALSTIEIQSKQDGFVTVGDRLVLNQVYFYNNTYALKPGAENELNQLVAFLNGNSTVEVEIQGHTANNNAEIIPDPNFKGQGKEWNFKGSAFALSEERANAVRDYLIANGINKKRIKAVGYGDTQKRIPEAATFEEFEKNMRVEALIIKE